MPHVPVLLDPLLTRAAPVAGVWLDGTFGAGGYTRGLLEAGASHVIGVDRDPDVFGRAGELADTFGEKLSLVAGNFDTLDQIAEAEGALGLDGVVLDIGVSSMQLDQADRGFSFGKDGPLDMRMAQAGPTAADLVNTLPEGHLADILHQYGEERASRRIARAVVADRVATPFTRTRQLAGLIERLLPTKRPGQPHPATRSFQALRIAVNDELGALARGLMAAERALKPGGVLAVVTFHSLEDRVVKRFLKASSGDVPRGNRYQPEVAEVTARFTLITRKAVEAEPAEVEVNARARSAKLRMARRTDAAGIAAFGRVGRTVMMRLTLYLATSALVVAFAFWAYHVNYTTQEAVRRVDNLRQAISTERAAISMLNAEWAYLNRPDRLRALAEEYFGELQLGPMTANHFGDPAMVAYPVPEDQQLADAVLDAVLESSQ